MRSVLFFTLVFSVASVFGQQPFVRHPDNLRKAVPHHFNHDQKNAYRSVDKIARGHKVGPRQAPLRPQQTVPWLQWVQEGRWAAQADRNSEMLKVRAKLLEEKLKPNQFIFKPQINPQLKPKLNKKENGRIKREIEESRRKSNKEIKVNENPRHKRDVMMSQHIPKVVMPSEDQFEGRIKETEKRHKRQIVYFINRPPQLLARSPRTTPNPFIRDTHIDDYDIIRPEVGEREGMIPTVESGSSDPGSYPLVTIQKVLSDLSKKILNLVNLITGTGDKYVPSVVTENEPRGKRSPKMSRLKKKQKVEKKKRKKKKQKELSPRQLKHIRRKLEKRERRKKEHQKKLKEKRRLRHKKLGTGPYNKTIVDYYGIYYEPPSSQLNESLYDSIYDTSEIDSDAIYEERMKERYDDYPESESVDSDAYYDEQLYGDTKESGDQGKTEPPTRSKEITSSDKENTNKGVLDKQHKTTKQPDPPHTPKSKKSDSAGKGKTESKKKE